MTEVALNTIAYLQKTIANISNFRVANDLLVKRFGIVNFFEKEKDFFNVKNNIFFKSIENEEKIEYGDFQTNMSLCDRVAKVLMDKNFAPQIIIEPTCGKGNFIISALKQFKNIEKIIAIEVYKPYLWECKLAIIEFYKNNPRTNKPEIILFHKNIFSVDLEEITNLCNKKECLLLGNPPWVTNSKLGTLHSKNLPQKKNLKNQKGLDALMGKSNFDIAEYICSSLIRTFQHHKGAIALLVKSIVIKNMVFEQRNNNFRISTIEKLIIDCKKEFNVATDASLFVAKLNDTPSFQAHQKSIYNDGKQMQSQFGWVNNKFVSNIEKYQQTQNIDGKCTLEWRQGLKHDCSKIMEIEKQENYYVNKQDQKIKLEEDLVYPILKSSDLKGEVISQARKYTIVTQQKIGQSTNYIQHSFPLTYNYLIQNISYFTNRKSNIYDNKPLFSIFGVGDYSFKPYKVAISGLYKKANFTLIMSQNNKPIFVDDTCYMLGFDNLNFALYTFILLNSEMTSNFLEAITFRDTKRMFTKDVLKRIDLSKLTRLIDKTTINNELNRLNNNHNLQGSMEQWNSFMINIEK